VPSRRESATKWGTGFDDQGANPMRAACCALGGSRPMRPHSKSWWNSLADQYSGIRDAGSQSQRALTLGENIGDLGGLSVAYEAYHLSLDGKERR